MAKEGDRSSSSLTVRRPSFEYSADLCAHWNPDKIEWSHMVSGASLTMPYLEPFLIKSVRAALPRINDPDLRAEANDYCGQEGQHYRQHRRFNDRLIEQGYAGLLAIEARIELDYSGRLEAWSLEKRLAYTAGFETMALSVGHWLIDDREYLFGSADPAVASLVLWHFVEEIEHKNAAFDIYQAVVGKYPLRIFGLVLPLVPVSDRIRARLTWGAIVSAWTIVVVAAIDPLFPDARGLAFGGNLANTIAFVFFYVGIVAVTGVVATIAFRCLRRPLESDS